jgi:phosphoglycerol geranylgeranyltransferase
LDTVAWQVKLAKQSQYPTASLNLPVAHALAGQYLGMRFIYLEGGSGVATPVPPEMIQAVKKIIATLDCWWRHPNQRTSPSRQCQAGADIIVTGNITETSDANETHITDNLRN